MSVLLGVVLLALLWDRYQTHHALARLHIELQLLDAQLDAALDATEAEA